MAVRTAPEHVAALSEQAERTVHPRSAPLAGFSGTRRVPPPVNEPIKSYAPGSPERAELKARLKEMANERIDIPIIIGGQEIRSGTTAHAGHAARPQARARRLAQGVGRVTCRRRSSPRAKARAEWGNWAWEDRAAVFLRAAELLATTWRQTLNAATMLGQSKTAFQAEIDAACELIDFWRFNPAYAQELLRRAAAVEQHDVEPARLPAARGIRLRGDAVQLHVDRRQPADRAGADGQHRDLEAGGDGDAVGVLHHAAARGGGAAAGRDQLRAGRRGRRSRTSCCRTASSPACTSPAARACSTACGRRSARTCRSTLPIRASSARRAARTSSSRIRRPIRQALAVAIARGGFEYQGQKCSAASRVYIPRSMWNDVRDRVVAMMDDMRMGDVTDFRNFMGAVIDEKSHKKISDYLDDARRNATIDQRRRRQGRPTATSSSRRSSRRTIPATGCSARRSSDRSSPRTSTTTRSGARRSRSSTERRRTR